MRETTPSMMRWVRSRSGWSRARVPKSWSCTATMPPARVTRTISRRMASEFRTWKSTVTAKTQSKRSGGKAQPRAGSHRVDEARPEKAGTAGETTRGVRHDMARIHAYHLSPRSHRACSISSDDAGARVDLQHALATTDPGEAEEVPSQTRLGGRAAARLEVADVALGLALTIDGVP